ncbi:hypothetical protein K469DRAFT_681473 [Zopfia rhizophila CBS 207.26]|uniref:LDB19 N-terminal domain-containing protein n=1 Tax=Zopfia rhizophila CBS 207.26 TaxID=1314779 RepID=A0A6A6EWF7_9PEZI|nr:hypothetical protein K469DRAFT_681473 [Zopfia rhizophila CBS 207.26]
MIRILVDSPPLIFIGNAHHPTGALISGRLFLHVLEPTITIEMFRVRFLCTTTALKPVARACPDCASRTNELEQWDFLENPCILSNGEHEFPFSCLVPSDLPITTRGLLGSIDYHLVAEVLTSTQETICSREMIDIKRATTVRKDIRAVQSFPSTGLTAQCIHPSVIHPVSEFRLHMRLTGITSWLNNIQVRLHLRELVWWVEERQEMVPTACSRHAAKVGHKGNSTLDIDKRSIGRGKLKSGWIVDFGEGVIETEFLAAVDPSLKPICDVDSKNGLSVSHSLVIEMTVAQELCLRKNPAQMAPSVADKVLWTRFRVALTERGGSGIHPDEEPPPTYKDVPTLPPAYSQLDG